MASVRTARLRAGDRISVWIWENDDDPADRAGGYWDAVVKEGSEGELWVDYVDDGDWEWLDNIAVRASMHNDSNDMIRLIEKGKGKAKAAASDSDDGHDDSDDDSEYSAVNPVTSKAPSKAGSKKEKEDELLDTAEFIDRAEQTAEMIASVAAQVKAHFGDSAGSGAGRSDAVKKLKPADLVAFAEAAAREFYVIAEELNLRFPPEQETAPAAPPKTPAAKPAAKKAVAKPAAKKAGKK